LSLLLQIRNVVDERSLGMWLIDALCIPQSDNVSRGFFDHEVSRDFQRPNDRGFSATGRTSKYVSFHVLLGLGILFDEYLRKLDQHGDPPRQERRMFGRRCDLTRCSTRGQKLRGR
jgi:hypothetical protein